MTSVEFVQRQGELRYRLRHAVPRSQRARELEARLKALLREELEREIGARPIQKSRNPESRTDDAAPDRTMWWDR